MLVKRMNTLTGIDPKSWEHPADRAALSALKQIKGFDELVKLFISVTTERSFYLMQIASSIKVSQNQYPVIYRIIQDIKETFDWEYTPQVFVTQSPSFNAHTLGVKEPFIVINSSLINTLSDDELKVVIAHEFGHIMSGHALYKTMIHILANVSLNLIPMAGLLLIPIKIALAEWDKKSELTADRAAMLATQIEMPNYNVLMKMAGGNDLSQVNINDIFLQAMEYENKKNVLDSIHKILNQIWASHPYPVVRLQEIKTWTSSGYFSAIMQGNYINRNHHEDNAKDDIKEGFNYYKDTVNKSDDPIMKFAANIGAGINKASEEVNEYIKRKNS